MLGKIRKFSSTIFAKIFLFLLKGPFGSDQSRHVDDFGAKKCNFDAFVAGKRSVGCLFREQIKILRASGHICIYE